MIRKELRMKNIGKITKTLLGWGLTFLSVVIIADLSIGQTCAPPSAGLVSWWKGDGNLNDSQDGNTGCSAGSVTYATGKVGEKSSFSKGKIERSKSTCFSKRGILFFPQAQTEGQM